MMESRHGSRAREFTALSPKEMYQAVVAKPGQKTGRGLADGGHFVRGARIAARPELMRWLKQTHAFGRVTAHLVASHVLGDGAVSARADVLLARPVAAAARPRFDGNEAVRRHAAPGVERVVCETYVGFRRGKQFAAVGPEGEAFVVALVLGGRGAGAVADALPRGSPNDARTPSHLAPVAAGPVEGGPSRRWTEDHRRALMRRETRPYLRRALCTAAGAVVAAP
jgi:hypothetical protein